MKKTDSFASKIGMTIFALLFGGAFTLGGIFAGIAPMVTQTADWWAARSFVAMPAQITSLELKTSNGGDSGTTYRVDATFAYTVDGRNYTGSTTTFGKAFDNIDNYHHQLYASLKQAQDNGGQVSLWVDPVDPQRSIYDRKPRWQLNMFHIPFMTLFPAVGLGALWFIYGLWFRKSVPAFRFVAGSDSATIRAEDSGAKGLLVASIVWNLLSVPIAALVVNGVLHGASKWALLVLVFPLVGFGMLAGAIFAARKRRRIGDPLLVLRAMAPLQGRIHFTPPLGERLDMAQLRHDVTVDVLLVKDAGPGEDDKPVTLWEQTAAATKLPRGAATFDFQIAVPPREADDVGVQVVLKALDTEIMFKLPRAELAGAA